MKLFFTIMFVAAIATVGFSQISGSAHDFSGAAWNTGTTEICIVCHTPHNANTTTGTVLWNRTTTITAFTPYSSATFQGSATITVPGGISLLCLSCHDGSIALENYGGVTTGVTLIGTAIGDDLSTEHPISFAYDNDLFLADGGLYDPAVAAVSDLLFGDQLECASCHDVHNAGFDNLLRMDNAGSALCLTCHNK